MFTELLLNANMRSMSSFLRDNSFDDFCFLSASRSVVGVSYCSLIYVCINNLYRNCSTCFPPDCVCVCFYVIVFLCVCRLQTADQYFNPLENATVLFCLFFVGDYGFAPTLFRVYNTTYKNYIDSYLFCSMIDSGLTALLRLCECAQK